MRGHVPEIIVRRQHSQPMPDAELGEQDIDRADLHACPAASIPQLRRRDVVPAIGNDKGDRFEAVNDLLLGLWAGKSL